MSDLPPLFPPQDHEEFAALKTEVKTRVWRLYDVARTIHAAPRAAKTRTYRALAAELGVSFSALYGPVNAYLKSGDWHALVDRRRHSELWVRETTAGLPHAFVEYWKTCVESNQRCAAAAYDFLMLRLAAWRRGDPDSAIPGYTTPPANARGFRHPPRWSYRDLCRKAPNDIELAAAREGRTAARALLPAVLTTRKTGYPFQELQFDDMWHDFQVIHGTQLTRILEFGCVDWYSTYIFSPGLKPRLNMDGVNKALTEKDFRLYAVNLMHTVGWSPRGTVLRGERGTAAFRAGLADKLRHWSAGLITIPLPGMSGAPALTGGFPELAKGNPNAKALKESLGKIIHNRLAALPGQTGMNPANQPASAHGRNADTMALLALQGVAPGLRLSHLTFDEGVRTIYQAYDLINRRWEHDNEGWEEEGLITQDYLADPAAGVYLPLASIPAEQRGAFEIIARHSPGLVRTRRMSPAEVISPHFERNIRLTTAAMFDCLYDDAKRLETVSAGMLEFRDKDIGPGVFRYPAFYQRPDGFRQRLENGEQVHLVVNPFAPETAGLFTLAGRYLGALRRKHAVIRADEEALHRRIGAASADYKDATLAASYRHGLKRESQLTENARILLDSITPTAPAAPPTSLPDLSEEYAEAAASIQPQAAAASIDPSILL